MVWWKGMLCTFVGFMKGRIVQNAWFHIVVMVVSTVAIMFLTLSQAILIHVITTSQASPAL